MKQRIRLTDSQLYNIVNESVKRLISEKFEYIYDDYTDILDMYYNQVMDGKPLSGEQIRQVEEIRDYLIDHDANDNIYLPTWIRLADDLANGQKPYM